MFVYRVSFAVCVFVRRIDPTLVDWQPLSSKSLSAGAGRLSGVRERSKTTALREIPAGQCKPAKISRPGPSLSLLRGVLSSGTLVPKSILNRGRLQPSLEDIVSLPFIRTQRRNSLRMPLVLIVTIVTKCSCAQGKRVRGRTLCCQVTKWNRRSSSGRTAHDSATSSRQRDSNSFGRAIRVRGNKSS